VAVVARKTRADRQPAAHFGIPTRLVSLHAQRYHLRTGPGEQLARGESVALASDVRPRHSDQGAELVRLARAATSDRGHSRPSAVVTACPSPVWRILSFAFRVPTN
jgi:16S rRNA C1402 (ribose-2'-O) methylase RsmI